MSLDGADHIHFYTNPDNIYCNTAMRHLDQKNEEAELLDRTTLKDVAHTVVAIHRVVRDVDALRSAHAERLERLEAAAGVLGGVVGAVDGTPLSKILKRIELLEAGDRVGNAESALAEAQQRIDKLEAMHATWQDATTKATFHAHEYPVTRVQELEVHMDAHRSAGFAADAASYAAGPPAARLRAARERARKAEAEVTRLRDILALHGIES